MPLQTPSSSLSVGMSVSSNVSVKHVISSESNQPSLSSSVSFSSGIPSPSESSNVADISITYEE